MRGREEDMGRERPSFLGLCVPPGTLDNRAPASAGTCPPGQGGRIFARGAFCPPLPQPPR